MEAELEVLQHITDRENNFHEYSYYKEQNEKRLQNNEKVIEKNNQIEKELKQFLSGYELLTKYFIANKKNFTKNTITRYLTDFEKSITGARKSSGLKRKKKIKAIKDKFYDINTLDDNSKFYFNEKMFHIYRYIEENKDENRFLQQYYYEELYPIKKEIKKPNVYAWNDLTIEEKVFTETNIYKDIKDEDWKNHPAFDFKSKQEYIKYLKTMEERDEMELEMNKYFYNEKNKS